MYGLMMNAFVDINGLDIILFSDLEDSGYVSYVF